MARLIVVTTEGQADHYRGKLPGQHLTITHSFEHAQELSRGQADVIVIDPKHLLPHPDIPLAKTPDDINRNRQQGQASYVQMENWSDTINLLARSGLLREKRRHWANCE